jgi:hypothetical protein
LISGDTDLIQLWWWIGSRVARPPNFGSVPTWTSCASRSWVLCHVRQKFARSAFGPQPNLRCPILQFEIARLLGVDPDGFRFVAYRFDFIDAMSSGQCFAGSIVADECDGHTIEFCCTCGPDASGMQG